MFLKPTIYKISLNALHYSGMARLLEHVCAGVGSLLTLHHVRPRSNPGTFAPNRGLEITPEFFAEVIHEVRKLACEFVSLDEFQRRMQNREFEQRFVSFTLDDGYEDNYVHAYPVFKQYEIPFAIYVCTGILDGSATLWWRDLEEIIRQSDEVRFPVRGTMKTLATQGLRKKYRAFAAIYWAFRALTHERQLEIWERFVDDNRCDSVPVREKALSWASIQEMQSSGLLTIGAHTANHYALSKLSDSALHREISDSRTTICQQTGTMPMHFAYPYGDSRSAGHREFSAAKDAGFATAVTTQKGVILPEHARQMHALPRISLNGDYQHRRYIRVLLTGVPFAIHRWVQ